MIEVRIRNKSPYEILSIVQALKTTGLVQGIDFDFTFYQSKWDDQIGEIPKTTIFTFYKDNLATIFALKYG